MFSYQRIGWPQDGQRERGGDSVIVGRVGDLHAQQLGTSIHQPRSSISGRRWITTFRKLPMHRPSTARTQRRQQDAAMADPCGTGVQTTEPSLKIGRYIETTMPPISTPRMTMMNGSIRLDRPLTASSTSSS